MPKPCALQQFDIAECALEQFDLPLRCDRARLLPPQQFQICPQFLPPKPAHPRDQRVALLIERANRLFISACKTAQRNDLQKRKLLLVLKNGIKCLPTWRVLVLWAERSFRRIRLERRCKTFGEPQRVLHERRLNSRMKGELMDRLVYCCCDTDLADEVVDSLPLIAEVLGKFAHSAAEPPRFLGGIIRCRTPGLIAKQLEIAIHPDELILRIEKLGI